MRRTYLAADGVSSFQIKFADLGGRHINIVGAGQVVVVRGAQKAVAVRQNFQYAFGKNVPFFFALGLQDLEYQVLLAQTACARQIERARNAGKFSYVLLF